MQYRKPEKTRPVVCTDYEGTRDCLKKGAPMCGGGCFGFALRKSLHDLLNPVMARFYI